MREIKIKNKLQKEWQGTGDNDKVRYAVESARKFGNNNTVDQNWRWLADDLGALYEMEPDIAAATYNYINGWISGASAMLNKALLNLWK